MDSRSLSEAFGEYGFWTPSAPVRGERMVSSCLPLHSTITPVLVVLILAFRDMYEYWKRLRYRKNPMSIQKAEICIGGLRLHVTRSDVCVAVRYLYALFLCTFDQALRQDRMCPLGSSDSVVDHLLSANSWWPKVNDYSPDKHLLHLLHQ
jgi:hypothetical protein